MIAAGGTGGHVYPALAVAEAINIYHPNSTLFFVGSVDGFERPLVEKGGVSFAVYDEVQAGPVHGVSVLRAVKSLFQIMWGTLQAVGLLNRRKPDVVLLTGGWVGLPVALAAWVRRVPSLIYLPDIEPALSIKVLRPFTSKVAVSVDASQAYFSPGKTIVTGYPIRAAVAKATREEAYPHFELEAERKTLLVFGGSRGAATINAAVFEMAARLIGEGVQIIHIVGRDNYDTARKRTATLHDSRHYHLRGYLHGAEMGMALAAADLVVSRSGAAVMGEFPLFGLPAILVPYPYAWRYQKVNADYLAERGAAVHLPDEEMKTKLYETIHALFTNEEQLARMRDRVKALAQPDSARRVAAVLAQLTGEKQA